MATVLDRDVLDIFVFLDSCRINASSPLSLT